VTKQSKKFHIFHQGHSWKAADIQEDNASAEYPVVAASHSQQNSGVMRKTVGQPINRASRQANPKITASCIRIIQYARDFIQASLRDFGINMHKPEHFATRSTCTHVHLHSPIGFAPDELIAKPYA
jgi:hypothetical protein